VRTYLDDDYDPETNKILLAPDDGMSYGVPHSGTRLRWLQETESKVNNSGKQKKAACEWMCLATVVDRLCFCLFTMFFGIATVVVFRRQLLPF